jgi:hypothetical protein
MSRDFARMHDEYLDPDRAGLNDVQFSNEWVKAAFPNADGPGELYRQTYKYTACGPSLGIVIRYWQEATDLEAGPNADCFGREVSKTLHCSDLYKLGTWEDMDARGELVTAILVSSIVEGVDYDCDTVSIELNGEDGTVTIGGKEFNAPDAKDSSENLTLAFDVAVQQVNDQANEIWMDTHGCESCVKHWRRLGDDCEVGSAPVYTKCRNCKGRGTIL